MSLFPRLFGRTPAAKRRPDFSAPLVPAEPLAVIGDVHGCAVLLERLLDIIAARGTYRVIFVGDLLDRGEQSAAVLARVHAMQKESDAVVLKGNHEEMLLQFLQNPLSGARRWLRFGGLQTLASFRIGAIGEGSGEEKLFEARDALAEAIGPDRLAWLTGLPTRFRSGNVAVVHAGADPAVPIEEQSEHSLTWGHKDFLRIPRTDGTWVVHGHTICDEVLATSGRIGVDTGAYATGRLSAALISERHLDVLSAKT